MKNYTKVLVAVAAIGAILYVLVDSYYSVPELEVDNLENESYDALLGLMESNLRREFFPMTLSATKGETLSGEIIESDRLYGDSWIIGNKTFYVHTLKNSDNPGTNSNMIEVFEAADSFDQETAEDHTRLYFTNSSDMRCRKLPISDNIYCESLLSQDNSKIFVGVMLVNNTVIFEDMDTPNILISFVCEIPSDSENYDWNSCNEWFKEAGV